MQRMSRRIASGSSSGPTGLTHLSALHESGVTYYARGDTGGPGSLSVSTEEPLINSNTTYPTLLTMTDDQNAQRNATTSRCQGSGSRTGEPLITSYPTLLTMTDDQNAQRGNASRFQSSGSRRSLGLSTREPLITNTYPTLLTMTDDQNSKRNAPSSRSGTQSRNLGNNANQVEGEGR